MTKKGESAMEKEVADIGLIGLAVMGQNLVLNMDEKGFCVAVFNRTVSKVDDFLQGPAKGTKVAGAHSLEEFFRLLKRPRKVMLMVKAGAPVDELIDQLILFLERGDIVIDGGNSHFFDTERREKFLRERGIFFIGTGISGGEEGARHGPSIMPGGSEEAWPAVKPMFQAISAKASDGAPCCEWIGSSGAGHFVKMVHNGIEYGDLQLISEAYLLMKKLKVGSADKIGAIFSEWNKGVLSSYLIEITAKILAFKEPEGSFLIDKILDVAGQKGTGKWTALSALDLGVPVTLIVEAVFARCLSALKEERILASRLYPGKTLSCSGNQEQVLSQLQEALYLAKIFSYTQGFMLLRQAAQEYAWKLNYGAIALIWRAGCIIRSRFLDQIKQAFDLKEDLKSLLFDSFFQEAVLKGEESLRAVVSFAACCGVPMPCFGASLAFFDCFRSEHLSANLIQAQRDFFGAHTYERVDRPRGVFFHTNWTETGGKTAAGSQ